MRTSTRRRAGVLATAIAAGVLCTAAPASADVTVSPPSAPQGVGAALTFRVTNTGQAPVTRVKLSLPADTAVAELYPLSVPDWAAEVKERRLATPLPSVHGRIPVTEAPSEVTWIAMPGKALAPGTSSDLRISLGPLPGTSSMNFRVQPMYADGRAGPAEPPVVLALTPAPPGQAAGGHGHGGAGGTAAEDAQIAQILATAPRDEGPAGWTVGAGIGAVASAVVVAVTLWRGRRRPQDDDGATGGGPGTGPAGAGRAAGEDADRTADEIAEADAEAEAAAVAEGPAGDAPEPVGAGAGGARVTSWSYRDGPG